jgi:hypothetical protein
LCEAKRGKEQQIKSMTEMDPQFRHDLVSGLNTLYGILFADTQGWEPIHPSVREQLSLIVERLAAIIPDEDRILKKNWTVVAPGAHCHPISFYEAPLGI